MTLGKVTSLPSANVWRSAKVTTDSYRRLLTALCRASSFVERVALDKEVFAECLSMSSVLLSVNEVVTESVTLLSAALDKEVFAECPTKNTRQSAEHSAKSRGVQAVALATAWGGARGCGQNGDDDVCRGVGFGACRPDPAPSGQGAAPEMVGRTSCGCWRMMAATSADAGADDVGHLWPRCGA
jgi:hypothetical protein